MVAFGCAHTPEIAKEAAKQGAAVAAAVTTGTPAVEVPESYFDFGKVDEGTNYAHSFVIRNKGTGVLEIKKVVPGCGTSVASFDRAIPPGSEGKITIRLYPKNFQTGSKKTAIVLTNDPQWPEFGLVVQGKSS
jgi:hypothetical protein